MATKTTLPKSEPKLKHHNFRPRLVSLFVLLIALGLVFSFTNNGAAPITADTYSTSGTYTWSAPTGVTSVTVEAWGAGGSGGGSLNGYSYRRSITINHTKVPNTDQSNFPVLISGAYSYLATAGYGGNVQNSNGYDVIFTSDTGCATKLNHEVETYNAATGAANYWIKIPTISHTTDTVFYMCYGNAGIATDQSNKTAVWDSNFKGVWHLPNGTALTTTDSTANANNGSSNSASATSGVVDGAASYNGYGQYTVVTNPTNFDFEYNQAFSLELWLKKPLDTNNNQSVISKKRTYWEAAAGYDIWVWAGSTAAIFDLGNSDTRYEVGSSANVEDNNWHHIVATYDGSSNQSGMRIYVDGSLSGTGAPAPISNSIRNSYNLTFGCDAAVPYTPLNGSLDEVRVSNTNRSADWIKTEYNNQQSPSTFYSISPADGNQSPVANAGGPYSGTVGTAVQFNGGGSYDPDGTISNYSWSFGDGGAGSGVTPTHAYTSLGTYAATLTVTDSGGAQSSANATVTIGSSGAGTYTYRRTITIDHNKVPNTDQTNFPVLISGSYSYLATTGNGGNVQNANGYDVIFTSDLGCATKLNHEVESWTANGVVNYWVKVTNVSHTTDTVFYLCYGNSSVSSDQSNRPAVWDANYKGVWHFADSAANTTVAESTSNSYSGAATANTNTISVAGQIGRGLNFNGTSDKVSNSSFSWPTGGAITVSFWQNMASADVNNRAAFSIGGLDNPNRASSHAPWSDNNLYWDYGSTGGGGRISTSYGSYLNAWTYVVLVSQGNSGTFQAIYFNGNQTASSSVSDGPDISLTSLDIGAWSAFGEYQKSKLDEFRVSNTTRSADWIRTEYNNQNSPSTFYSISAASGGGGNQSPVANAGGPYSGTVGSAVQFNGSGSYDPDGSITSYSWTFGDGGTGSGVSPTHTYSSANTYTATLTVTDNNGAQSSANATVTISGGGGGGFNGYTYRRTITIDHTKVPNTDQTNFPVLISGSYSYLATTGNGGNVQNANGYDVIFTSDPGCVTKLNHEVETWTANGVVNYWVKVPNVSHTTDTVFYLCYGNSSISSDQSNRPGVWNANYKGVWHLNESTGGTATDSTNTGNGSPAGTVTAATGQVGGAQSFDGNSASIVTSNTSVYSQFTYSAWVKPSSTNLDLMEILSKRSYCANSTGDFPTALYLNTAGTSATVYVDSGNDYGMDLVTTSGSFSNNQWHYVTGTYSGATLAIYVDGVLSNSANGSVNISTNSQPWTLGRASQNGTGCGANRSFYNGIIDEARVSNVALSADWTRTEFNNQSSPSTFYSISSASGGGGNQSPVANAGGPYSGTVGSAVQFNGSGSYDPDGGITSYSWTFGDGGGTGSGVSPTHTYASANTYTATLTVTDNGGAQSSANATVTITGGGGGGPQNVVWTNVINAIASGNNLTKTGSSAWDGGAVSTQSIPSGDGYVEFTAGTYSAWTMCGLSHGDNGQSYTDIDFALYLGGGELYVYEDGVYRGDFGTYATGDLFRVAVEGGAVKYRKNGQLLYTGLVAPTYPLLVDTSLYPQGSQIVNAVISGASGGGSAPDARLDPMNRTGAAGEDPLSRNFNWSLPLVSLPGRAGLDLNLSLTYNSLATWLKQGSTISFDGDHGYPAPGFRLGFPVIQPAFYNSQTQTTSYLLITPAGARVELRQVSGQPTLFQAFDSSYLLLDATNATTYVLKTTDGTQLSYAFIGNQYVCTKIQDRNGNFITIGYESGRLKTITDTLQRTITFNYSGSDLISITQPWTINGQSQQHPWAQFFYADKPIQTNFPGLTVSGPQNGSTIHALSKVTLADNSHFDFDYTTWGQVRQISEYATDNHLLNYHWYDLPQDGSSAQTDCPRFGQRHDRAENWNDASGNPLEAMTSFANPSTATWSIPDNSTITGTETQITLPDNTSQKILFGNSADAQPWKNGLPLATLTYSGGSMQRWTKTTWTQDLLGVSYISNPRVTETNVGDPAGNRARTKTDYTTISLSNGTSVRLPSDVYEYQADATSVLRRTHTDYNNISTYTDRRIIGLVIAKYFCDSTQGEVPCNAGSGAALISRATIQYDDVGSILGNDAPVQHDSSFGASFVAGRGNVTGTTRIDVTNFSQSTTSTVRYNTAGSVVATSDPMNHQVTISYADSFSDGLNGRNTLAYPTTITDADLYSSTIQYNYDFGAVTRKQTPLPNSITNVPGPVQTLSYNSFGRLERVTNSVNSAYTRYVYGPNYLETFATVNNPTDEAHSLQVFDGAGRVIAKASNHPGSTGGFSAQRMYYDSMGRSNKQSNPTETWLETVSPTAPLHPYSWQPSGDDAAAGWVYTNQTYDWKGRPRVTTNPDNTTKSASYAGCGCAGGEVVTLTDEVQRRQKVYSDVLGRHWKTETLNWDGTIYSTRTMSYNSRDQITSVKQYQGPESSGIYQESVDSFDGYGRLSTHKEPIQTTATTYNYYPNDKPQTVTDPRGVTTTFGYNNRGLVTGVSYSGTSVAPVSYTYDAAGNRLSMADGSGSVTYAYDGLSRLTSETRHFAGTGAPSGNYGLNYEYTLSGQMKSITDPAGSRIDYAYDSGSRLASVTGSGPVSVPTYVSNFGYRASGAIKDFDFGNTVHQHLDYNSRLLNTGIVLSNLNVLGSASWVNQYYADGKLWKMSASYDPRFDREFDYDQTGRIKEARTGSEARGGTTPDGPFRQSYSYDVWENTTGRTHREGWSQTLQTESIGYTNNQHQFWYYDNAGNPLITYDATFEYDAAGHQNRFLSKATVSTGQSMLEVTQTFDGNGAPASKAETTRWEDSSVHESTTTTYFLRSTVLGGKVVAELDNTGYKRKGYIYAGGMLVATQDVWNGQVTWQSTSPTTGSEYLLDSGPYLVGKELDPLGADANAASQPAPVEPPYYNPKFDQMPIEYEWGPSEEYLQANADWDATMRFTEENIRQANEAQQLWQSGNRAAAEAILHNNPNVGIQTGDGRSYFGNDAAEFLDGLLANGDPQNLAPLPNRTNNNLTKATNALASKLAAGVSKDCQKNVIDKLKGIGFDTNGFINFLGNNPQFYNGLTSQALVAGTVSPKQPADLLYGPGATIADVFKGSGNTRPNALTSITSSTFLSFFRPDAISGSGADAQSLIFHEGIHGFTGKVDADIQGALGIKQTPISQNITDYIRKQCF